MQRKILLAVDLDNTHFLTFGEHTIWIGGEEFWVALYNKLDQYLEDHGVEFIFAVVTSKIWPDDISAHAALAFKRFLTKHHPAMFRNDDETEWCLIKHHSQLLYRSLSMANKQFTQTRCEDIHASFSHFIFTAYKTDEILLLAKQHGIPANHCILLEDQPTHLAAASEKNIRTISAECFQNQHLLPHLADPHHSYITSHLANIQGLLKYYVKEILQQLAPQAMPEIGKSLSALPHPAQLRRLQILAKELVNTHSDCDEIHHNIKHILDGALSLEAIHYLFFLACQLGSLLTLHRLLKLQLLPSIDQPLHFDTSHPHEGKTLLAIAAYYGHYGIVCYLTDFQFASISASSQSGNSLLKEIKSGKAALNTQNESQHDLIEWHITKHIKAPVTVITPDILNEIFLTSDYFDANFEFVCTVSKVAAYIFHHPRYPSLLLPNDLTALFKEWSDIERDHLDNTLSNFEKMISRNDMSLSEDQFAIAQKVLALFALSSLMVFYATSNTTLAITSGLGVATMACIVLFEETLKRRANLEVEKFHRLDSVRHAIRFFRTHSESLPIMSEERDAMRFSYS